MKFFKYFLYLSPVIAFIVLSSERDMNQGELGTRTNPIRIYFTPSVDAEKITTNAKELIDFLEKETGYYFTTGVPTSYVAVVEAFGTKKADVAVVNTFSYLLANEKYGAEARLRVVRAGAETTYKGQIIARTDAGINSIQDIHGKPMAYVDPSSTSGYILPKALLDNNGIKPSETVFAMKHDNVVTMVYQRQVSAGATFYSPPDEQTGEIRDARFRVLKQFPDVAEQVKIIAFTADIPNDPFIFRADLPDIKKDKITKALLKFVETPEGEEALFEIYSVRGLVPTKDEDYDVLREMLKNLDLTTEELVK